MKTLKITPTKLSGKVKIPPSKSMAHRAIICAALSKEESVLTGLDFSEDIRATMEGMRLLGAKIIEEGTTLRISGENLFEPTGKTKEIFCNESGSTLRFLVPISLASENSVRFTGKGNLGKRPLTPFYTIFDQQQIHYTYEQDELNLFIEGELKPDTFYLKGNISSQFISGLLFTLPLLKGDSKICLTTPLESKGYIDLTIQMMTQFGIDIIKENERCFLIKGNQTYKATNYEIEGDYSQAAFYFVAGAIGNQVTCKGLDEASLQGDKVASYYLEMLGAKKQHTAEGIQLIGPDLKGNVIDGAECPDIIPVMAVAAALSEGQTQVIRAERLRIKECDRLYAIAKELNAIGANIIEQEDGLLIQGVKRFKGGCTVSSHKDHRIAMSMAIAATRCDAPILLEHPECVSKSYPGFWEDYRSLGGKIEEV